MHREAQALLRGTSHAEPLWRTWPPQNTAAPAPCTPSALARPLPMLAALSYQHALAACGAFLRLGLICVLSSGTTAVCDQRSCDDPGDTV